MGEKVRISLMGNWGKIFERFGDSYYRKKDLPAQSQRLILFNQTE